MRGKTSEKPVRVGVFATVADATRAVNGLVKLGFTKDQISVVCSNKIREQFFEEFDNPPLPADHLKGAVAAGSSIGAILGGLTALASITTTGGLGLAVAGLIFAAGGAASGGFVGAMMTRGFSKEVASYYDQAVTQGKILVGVEVTGENNASRLERAERVLADAGAEPLPLEVG